MFQLILSWFMATGIWLISLISQLILLLPQLMFKPTWISQGAQWAIKTWMDDSRDSSRDWLKSAWSHAKYSIRHPHPPLTRDVQILIIVTTLIGVWSGYQPYDRNVWFMEMIPILVMTLTLAGIFYRLPLTRLFYRLFFITIMFGLIGAHYTYGLVPIGGWLQEILALDRNHFDRMVRFVQGAMTFVFAREILWRMSPLKKGKWLEFLSLCISLVLGISYECLEWLMASQFRDSAAMYVAAQGDPWDTQWDMVWSLMGSIMSVLIFIPGHHQQLQKLVRYLDNLPPSEKKELIV